MSGGGARRWPLHPPPHPGEALSTWLQRLASRYELTVAQLLTHKLGAASALVRNAHDDDLDWDPPGAILEAIAEHTGTALGEVPMMTIGGWVPWLADSLDPAAGPEAFATYVRQDSVLLAPGERRRGRSMHGCPGCPSGRNIAGWPAGSARRARPTPTPGRHR